MLSTSVTNDNYVVATQKQRAMESCDNNWYTAGYA